MTEEESVKLLLHTPSFSEGERFEAAKIAFHLGYLALALDQAASYIGSRGLSLKSFMSQYDARKQKILQETPDHWEYRKKLGSSEAEQALSVFTTWEMSLGMIGGTEKEKTAKHRFLTLAAFFDNELISERYFRIYCEATNVQWMDLLKTGGKWDSYKLGDLLAECGKLSLIQIPSQQASELQFSIHPLICDWMKLRKKQNERQTSVIEAIEVLTAYLASVNFDGLPRQVRKETVSHVDACCSNEKHFCKGRLDICLQTLPASLSSFTEVYFDEHRHLEARRLGEQALSAWEMTVGIGHVQTLRAAHILGLTYRRWGQYEKAEESFRLVLNGFEKIRESKPDHEFMPLTLAYLANRCVSRRRYEEAEDLYKRAVVFSNDLQRTQFELCLFYFLREQGRMDEAIRLYNTMQPSNFSGHGMRAYHIL
jgi:tetratricopeptide (TPR) repeat protein